MCSCHSRCSCACTYYCQPRYCMTRIARFSIFRKGNVLNLALECGFKKNFDNRFPVSQIIYLPMTKIPGDFPGIFVTERARHLTDLPTDRDWLGKLFSHPYTVITERSRRFVKEKSFLALNLISGEMPRQEAMNVNQLGHVIRLFHGESSKQSGGILSTAKILSIWRIN